ncbi:MAG: PaaI family thioesterase [Clostridiales bacterium]|nr:PaaI family thioesterase [Clostridiales bacterium]
MDFCVNNRELLDTHIKALNSGNQFINHNNITLTRVEADRAEGELLITPQSLNLHNIVHGGCLAALADTISGSAVYAATGKLCVTVNYSMSFLRPATGKKVYCVARPQKVGRSLCVYETTLTDDNGRVVAAGVFTFYVLPDCEDTEQPSKPL